MAKMRGFSSVDAMDNYLVERWNSIVRPEDKVYHLGDVAHDKRSLFSHASVLIGHKRLVRGNHDILKTKDYIKAGFKEIYGSRKLEDIWLTHMPMHPASLRDEWVNVHGHVHDSKSVGEKYKNVCCEFTDYKPVELQSL